MTTGPDSVTYSQTIGEVGGPADAVSWQSTARPALPLAGMYGYAADLDDWEFRVGSSWLHAAWLDKTTTQSFVGPVTVNTAGAAAVSISSGQIIVPTSQSLSLQVRTAGQSISMGATAAGLGNALTVTVNSGGNTAQTATPNNVTIGNLLTSKFLLSSPGTITWSGSTTSGDTYNPFRMTGVTHTGTSSGSEIYLNLLNIAGTDNINATAGKVVGWRFNHNVAAGANGTRNGLHYQITTTGATTGMAFMTAANFFSFLNHSTGGTANTESGAAGAAFGLNSYAVVAAGLSNVREAVSYEADLSVRTASGVYRKANLQIVCDSLDVGRGLALDAGISFATQGGGAGVETALGIGGWVAQFPLYSTGMTAILRAFYGFDHPTRSPRTYWGINLIEADVAGWAFASKGFSVDGSGTVQIGPGVTKTVAGGMQIDVTGSVATAAAVAAGGTNYAVNDLLYDSDGAGGTYGGVYKVATISGSAVATVTILKAPFVPGATPANPIATTTWQTTGQGTGCTLNLTWPTTKGLYLQTSGGALFTSGLQASTSYANDAAAAGGGVAVGQLYRNGSVIQCRIV